MIITTTMETCLMKNRPKSLGARSVKAHTGKCSKPTDDAKVSYFFQNEELFLPVSNREDPFACRQT